MKQRTRVLAVWSGTGVAILGAILTVVYLFQPWRTFPTTTRHPLARCPMDAMVMWSTLVGLMIFSLGVFMKRDAVR